MKKLKFTCPHCEAKLRVPTHLAGVSAPCPKCGETITAPSDVAAAVFEPGAARRAAAQGSPQPVARTRAELPLPVPAGVAAAPRSPGGGAMLMEAPPAAATAVAPAPVFAEAPPPAPRPSPNLRNPPAPAVFPVPVPAEASVFPAPVPAEAAVLPVPVPAEATVDLAPAAPAPVFRNLAPAPPIPAPAFFTPPPPVRPLAPPWAEEEDERSAPPAPLTDEADVVVEEHYFEEGPTPPPPAVPITQPIRISAHRGDLPPARESSRGGNSLPRLDVALGSGDLGGANALPTPAEPHAPAGPTRVFLPKPGSSVMPTTPEDFLTPPPPANPPSLPPEVEVAEEPRDFEDFENFENFEDFQDFEQPAEIEAPAATATRYTTIPLPNDTEGIPLDDLEAEDEACDPIPGETAAPPPLPALPELPSFDLPDWQPEPLESIHPPAPDERSFAAIPRREAPAAAAPPSWQPPLADPVPSRAEEREEYFDDIPSVPLHEGSFGKLFAQQASPNEDRFAASPSPPAPRPAPERPVDEDLEALFEPAARGTGGRGVSRTVVALIASVAVVAVIAAVGVAFVIHALGGIPMAEAPVASEPPTPPADPEKSFSMPRIPTSSATATAPDLSIKEAPAIIDPPAIPREAAPTDWKAAPPRPPDAPALSFDEKVQQMVNGRGASVIGSPSLDIIETPVTDFSGAKAAAPAASPTTPAPPPPAPPAAPSAATETAPLAATETAPSAAVPGAPADPAPSSATGAAAPAAAKDPNYHPPDSFPAPGPDDKSTLGKTHDLIDAFLRAPDLATRLKYTFQGDSLRAAVEDYHKKWPYVRFERYSLQLYQMELDASIGGPYWVFIVSTSDDSEGFPFIVRTENGLLKADWEIFAEFSDRQFLRFRDGKMSPPATFRLILERFTDYYGSDRDAFADLADYLVYQVYPPYGETEFSEFVFVKKDSELGKKLDKLVGIGDEPLAVVVTLDQQPFAHGVKHHVVTELVTEGWFR